MANGKESIEAMYKAKRDYVERLNLMLAPLTDFDHIDYARGFMNDSEYIRMVDLLGNAIVMDVTGDDLEAILQKVAVLVIGEKPIGVIHDRLMLRSIASLFRS